jgi:hypothetical protein
VRRSEAAAGFALLLAGVLAVYAAPAAVRGDRAAARTAAALRSLAPAAELVWVHPGGRVDLAGWMGALPAVAADRLEHDDLAAFPELVLVGAGLPGPAERAAAGLKGRAEVTGLDMPEGAFPAWRVRPRDAFRVLHRLSTGLDSAVVSVTGLRERVGCPLDPLRAAHICPGPAWHRVERTEQVMAGRNRPCIWAHPPNDPDADLEVRFPAVRLADSIALGAGLSDHAVRKRDGAGVQITVTVGKAPTWGRTVPNRRGWRWLVEETQPGVADVVVRVRTTDAAVRHLCLELEVRGAP